MALLNSEAITLRARAIRLVTCDVDGVLTDMLKDGRWEKLYGQFIGQAPGLPSATDAKAKLPASS